MANINQQQLDENGEAHGEWIWYYTNDQIDHIVNFVHGIRNGFEKSYYEDGRVAFSGYWNAGREIGYWYYDFQPNEYYLWLI